MGSCGCNNYLFIMTPGYWKELASSLYIDGKNKLKSSIKSSDRAGISTAEVMVETATELSQKFTTE